MVIAEGHLAIIITTRAGPTTLVIDRLRPAQNIVLGTGDTNVGCLVPAHKVLSLVGRLRSYIVKYVTEVAQDAS